MARKKTRKKRGGKRSSPATRTSGRKSVRPHTLISPKSWLAIAGTFELSDIEQAVLHHIFDGCGELAIARKLRISRHTVHSRLRALYAKVDVQSRTELFVRVFAEYLLLNKRAKVVGFRPGRIVLA